MIFLTEENWLANYTILQKHAKISSWKFDSPQSLSLTDHLPNTLEISLTNSNLKVRLHKDQKKLQIDQMKFKISAPTE